jgi:hypothetical protein
MKLKKRLPALFLAFFLAFSPLMLAFPANADSGVLSDSSYSTISIESYFGTFPSVFSHGVLFFNSDQPIVVLAVSDSPFQLILSPGDYSFSVTAGTFSDVSLYTLRLDSVDQTSFDFSSVPLVPYPGGFILDAVPRFVYFGSVSISYGSVDPSSVNFVPAQLSVYSHVGVTSVFSRVASWLGGVVNNMISMFYSADSGLTVLGVLAVASLALAFTLLLFYLIAGWLKFR